MVMLMRTHLLKPTHMSIFDLIVPTTSNYQLWHFPGCHCHYKGYVKPSTGFGPPIF
ncbi:hypothetical protein HanHA300_Chr02g0049261 [Helianthus annuus]|nr:hypothetical protein HanHA300_Chr02g0049261 [Helianthus annuus]KAJ0618419.1 hypothetical protein HanHA89_Chr02g0053071 [Helianthus annuus]